MADLKAQILHYSKNEYLGIIDPETFKIQMETIQTTLRGLEKSLEEFSDVDFDITELLSFAKKVLESPGSFWNSLDFIGKTKFQWFVFPQGLMFQNSGFRTAKKSLFFNVKV
jgi:hypothetical protein